MQLTSRESSPQVGKIVFSRHSTVILVVIAVEHRQNRALFFKWQLSSIQANRKYDSV